MGKWCIGKIEFASKEDYKAGCRDLKRIQTLSAGMELHDHREAAELYEMLKKQPFLFESVLGREFRSYLKDKADGIRHPYGNFPEECLYSGKDSKKRKGAAKEAVGGKDGREAMRAGQMKFRERDIGRETERKEKDLEDFGDFDEEGQDAVKKTGKKKIRVIKPLCILAGFCLILFSLYKIFSYDIWSYISERKMEELASCILTPIEPEVSEAHRIADLIASGMYTEEEAINIARKEQEQKQGESVTEDGILYRYSVLYGRNDEMAGWIQLEGTVINYPVMLTPDDEEYYLKKGFDKKYDINGIPFMDARCGIEEPTTNFLIYGHNMKNGSMFSALLFYEEEEFYEEHKTVRFDTIYERGEYEIVGVFRTQIPYESDREAYRYYSFIDTQDEEEYNAYIRFVKEQSFYETGITAEYGTQLLTLSTCDRSIPAGRFVVVGRKK